MYDCCYVRIYIILQAFGLGGVLPLQARRCLSDWQVVLVGCPQLPSFVDHLIAPGPRLPSEEAARRIQSRWRCTLAVRPLTHVEDFRRGKGRAAGTRTLRNGGRLSAMLVSKSCARTSRACRETVRERVMQRRTGPLFRVIISSFHDIDDRIVR